MTQETTNNPQDEKPIMPLPDAVTNVSNTFFRLQKAQATLAQVRYDMIQAIKNNPELMALQEAIDIAENHAKMLDSEYSQAKAQVKESTLAEWHDGMDKNIYDGLLQVRVLSNSVLHWDAKKALQFALEAPAEMRQTLLTADKIGFKKLYGAIDMPADAIQIGDSLTVAIVESELINHVDMSIYENSTDNSTDETDESLSESDKAYRDGYLAEPPF